MQPADVEHLYFNGRHYDQRYKKFVEDIPFWMRMAKQYGDSILELACGTGRISIPMAKEGYRVTGIDISDSMLAEAKRKLCEARICLELIKADVRDFHLRRKFNLAIFPANTICHLLTFQDLEACFRCVKRHLEPSGKFVIDVFNPRFDILLRNRSQRYPHSEYSDPDGKGTIVITEASDYDSASQINTITLFYNIPGMSIEVVEELRMRIYFPQELDELLKYNGFRVEVKLGDYDGKPFRSDAPRQLFVCQLIR